MQTISAPGLVFTGRHEGFSSKAYYDPVRVLTIGHGFTWRSTAFRKWWKANRPGEKFTINSRMSREEAQEVLKILFDEQYGRAVALFLGHRVEQHVFDGMASPTFNLGEGCLDWKWAAAAKRGNYERSARLLRKTGTTAGGKRLRGLVRRRNEEAELLLHAVYSVRSGAGDSRAKILRRGQRGDAVQKLLHDLQLLGFYDGDLDGIFGRGAERAVLEFQRKVGLKDDGYAGPKTLKAIEAAVRAKTEVTPKPKPGPVAPDYVPEKEDPVSSLPNGEPGKETKATPATVAAAVIIAIVGAVLAFLGVKP